MISLLSVRNNFRCSDFLPEVLHVALYIQARKKIKADHANEVS